MQGYSEPAIKIYQSSAVERGTVIHHPGSNSVFLNPADAHTLRRQLMSNNKYDATFYPPPMTGKEKRELKRRARLAKARKLPLGARIAAGVLVGGAILGGFVACGASVAEGQRYDACIQKIAQEDGHEAAKLAQAQGECR